MFDFSRGRNSFLYATEQSDSWVVVMQQMHVCDQSKRYIPAEMEYGKLLHPSIPRGSTLIFEVELLGVD